LHQYLSDKYPGQEVLLVREPGATPIAEAIRKTVQATDFGGEQMHPLADVYLYAAARAQSLHTLVQPALERGAIVISDRSFITSLAYQ
jgi:dTMP kinase